MGWEGAVSRHEGFQIWMGASSGHGGVAVEAGVGQAAAGNPNGGKARKEEERMGGERTAAHDIFSVRAQQQNNRELKFYLPT
jgi:hypothetical protein